MQIHSHSHSRSCEVPVVLRLAPGASANPNASGLWALEVIDGQVLPGSQALAEQGRAVLSGVPWDALQQGVT